MHIRISRALSIALGVIAFGVLAARVVQRTPGGLGLLVLQRGERGKRELAPVAIGDVGIAGILLTRREFAGGALQEHSA